MQSNYVPWKGYFDLIHDVDLLIFLDDVQYTKGDWRNRNRIKTPAGPRWLTIPVGTPSRVRICDIPLPSGDWAMQHLGRLQTHYAAAPFFEHFRGFLQDMYGRLRPGTLSEFNQLVITTIVRDVLGVRTVIEDSRRYRRVGTRQEGLIEMLRAVGATVYLSGPAGQRYLDPERFADAGIELRWKDYHGYPEYPQLYPPFVHEVTILDLLFHVGPRAPELIWGWRDR